MPKVRIYPSRTDDELPDPYFRSLSLRYRFSLATPLLVRENWQFQEPFWSEKGHFVPIFKFSTGIDMIEEGTAGSLEGIWYHCLCW